MKGADLLKTSYEKDLDSLRTSLSLIVNITELLGIDTGREFWDHPAICHPQEAPKGGENSRTIADPGEAFASFREVAQRRRAPKGIDENHREQMERIRRGKSELEAVTQGWTPADYYLVAQHAYDFYGLAEP